MESEWELDRMRLYQPRTAHTDWILQQLAHTIGRCLSWVKKWPKRFREERRPSLAMFKSLSGVSQTNCGGSTGGDLRSAR